MLNFKIEEANYIESLADAPKDLRVVATHNPSSYTYIGWVPSSSFFKQGEMTENALHGLGPSDGRPYAWSVKQRWQDGTVRSAQIKTLFLLSANELSYVELQEGKTPFQSFQWHEALGKAVAENTFLTGVIAQCRANGQEVFCYPFQGQWKLLESTATSLVFRFRSHFTVGPQPTAHPLSMTTYVELNALTPVVKVTFVVGCDTLEMPVANGITVENFRIQSVIANVRFRPEAYGSMNFHLADGQTMAVDHVFSASNEEIALNAMRALGEAKIYGYDFYDMTYKAGMGVTPLPKPRIPLEQLAAANAEANNTISFPVAEAKAHIGHVNMNPPSTGSQPDFAATMPIDLQKAAMAFSNKALSRVHLSCLRESWRPSFFWETRDGKEERARATNYPTLFFWSGRPHWHPTWNPEYPVWQARGSLPMGNTGGWGSSDNQHLSNMHLRYLYQLTFDHYIGDVLEYYVSLDYWNYFTKWENNVEAERGFRTMTDALELTELFNTPDAAILKNKIVYKHGVTKNSVTQNITQWGIAGLAPFDGTDPRVNGGLWAQYGTSIAVAWQTGFHMAFEASVPNPELRYLDHVDKYFLPDGTPNTYFVFPNPAEKIQGGIGEAWWAGWIQLAEKYPNHPGSQFVLNNVKPRLTALVSSRWDQDYAWINW